MVRAEGLQAMLMNTHEARLDALRKELKTRGLDGFVIPISDEHMSEYVGAYAQRLAWLTGFGGSAGTAAVLTNKAAMFIDGRYTLQVREQVDGRLYEYVSVPASSVPPGWLRTHPKAQRSGLIRGCMASPGSMPPTVLCATRAPNWSRLRATRSTRSGPISRSPRSPRRSSTRPNYAGQSSEAKRSDVAEWLSARGLDAAVYRRSMASPGCSTCAAPTWSGHPLRCHSSSPTPMVPPSCSSPKIRSRPNCAPIWAMPSPCARAKPSCRSCRRWPARRVAVDPERAVQAVFGVLEGAGAKVVELTDPTVLAKAQQEPG
jgi:Xaa-Pro aminopeptidase